MGLVAQHRPGIQLKLFFSIYKNLIFYLCTNVARLFKNSFNWKDLTLKKNTIERTRISRWFGRENVRRMWFGIEIDVVGLPPLTWPLFLNTIPPFGNSWLRARFKKSYYPTSGMHSLHAGSEGMQMFPAKQFYILQRKVRGVICTSAHK